MLPVLCAIVVAQKPAEPPSVGEKAPPIDLAGLDKKPVQFGPLLKNGPVLLVFLRGYPGYQCPICTTQVGTLISNADSLEQLKTTTVLVYPGAEADLSRRVAEFLTDRTLPKSFRFVPDPLFRLTERYRLRWNAPGETAYPSTFVIGRDGKIGYAKVSRTHEGRAPLSEVFTALERLVR